MCVGISRQQNLRWPTKRAISAHDSRLVGREGRPDQGRQGQRRVLRHELAERAGHSKPSMSLDMYSHVIPVADVPNARCVSLLTQTPRATLSDGTRTFGCPFSSWRWCLGGASTPRVGRKPAPVSGNLPAPWYAMRPDAGGGDSCGDIASSPLKVWRATAPGPRPAQSARRRLPRACPFWGEDPH